MKLHYICANQVRAIIPVNDKSFAEAAMKGTLNEEMQEIVEKETAEYGNPQDLKAITGIIYSGALHEPDAQPKDIYGQFAITIYCDWEQSADTARFQVRGGLEQASFDYIVLRDIESNLRLGAPPITPEHTGEGQPEALPSSEQQVLYPSVKAFYEECAGFYDGLEKNQKNDIKSFIDHTESTYLTAVKERMARVRPYETRTPSSDASKGSLVDQDYYDVLGVNLELMEGLLDNLKILAG